MKKTKQYEVLARLNSDSPLHIFWNWDWKFQYMGYYIMTDEQYEIYKKYKIIWLNAISGGWTKKSAWKRLCQTLNLIQ